MVEAQRFVRAVSSFSPPLPFASRIPRLKPRQLTAHQRRRHPEKATYLTADNQMTRNLTVRRRTPADMADTTVPLTADNRMTRKPNLVLNAEIESMAERLTPQPQLYGTRNN